jgi:hypothetical protein
MSSGAGVALARKTTTQPTNPGQYQYVEKVTTIHGKKHTGKRHTSTSATKKTTSTGAGETSGTHAVGTAHHRAKSRKGKHHRIRKRVTSKPAASQRAHALSPKSSDGSGRLAAAVTTGSGGGISTWLLVVLILVLVSGSVAGILRYRRSH